MHICQVVPQMHQCPWFTKRTKVIHDTPDSLEQIQNTPVWNTGYSNRLESQRTRSCQPSIDLMVHSELTRTSNPRTPIMCQTWHCRTQLCSQPPEEEVGAAEEIHDTMQKKSNKIFETLKLHPSAPKKTTSKHIQIDSKELLISQELTTSPYTVMQNPLYMHHRSVDCYVATGVRKTR